MVRSVRLLFPKSLKYERSISRNSSTPTSRAMVLAEDRSFSSVFCP